MKSNLKILVACEFSGIVRDAFLLKGFNAISCDFLPCESVKFTDKSLHYQGDVRDILHDGWDLMIAHPDCQYLTNSGVRWLYKKDEDGNRIRNEERWGRLHEAANFFLELYNADIKHIAIENPIMHKHAKNLIGINQSQIIQPWMFGHGEIKATCLWLKNLPKLEPTDIVDGREPRIHKMAPSPNRWKKRSITYSGIADAMSEQWGNYIVNYYEETS